MIPLELIHGVIGVVHNGQQLFHCLWPTGGGWTSAFPYHSWFKTIAIPQHLLKEVLFDIVDKVHVIIVPL